MGLLLRFVFIVCFPLILSSQKVVSITIDGSISPATAGFIEKGINKASKENAECLLIHLNTPGGLLKSTRVIVSNILEAPIPVVVYVSPGGAHAGSAGVFVTMAAHVAAMAPGTNIGAAHPVSQGSMDTVMNEKATNDAAAFIRTIAQKRNRNLEWAEEAVRKSVSITGAEAVNMRVVDLMADNSSELLKMIDGRTVMVNSQTKTLRTANLPVEEMEMSFIDRILQIISDPNVAYILMMLGIYGLFFELSSPGTLFPGIIGVIFLILAFYSFHTLPVNYAGVALIVFGIILFLLEIKITSYGLLTIGGVISLLLGSFMLIKDDSALEFVRISRSVIISASIVSALFFAFIIGAAVKTQRLKPVIGLETFKNETGKALDDLDPIGTVMMHGEIWQAESLSGKIEKGENVIVRRMEHFKLYVDRHT